MSKFPECWVFDQNRRIYSGRGLGPPIWIEHWRKVKIVGENRVSWITECRMKIPKKNADPRSVAFSQADIYRQAFVVENRFKIGREVEKCDYETLKRIAEIIGYKEPPPCTPK